MINLGIYEKIKAELNKPRINKDEWEHYNYRLPESLAREGTTIQNYFSDYTFHKFITIDFNKTDKFDPENYEQIRKLNRKIYKGLEKDYTSDNDNYYSLSIFELHSSLKAFHSHTVNNIPPDIKDDEIKAQIKKIGKNKIKSVNVQSVYDQKGLCYYLSKGFNAEIYNEYRYKPDESEKGYKIKPPFDDYFKALPTNKRLHQTIGLKERNVPANDIITQSDAAVKDEKRDDTVNNTDAKATHCKPHTGKASKGNIVSYPNPIERRTANVRPLRTHSVIREPFQPKEATRKTALTRSRTARTGFTGHSLYNNKPPPHTRAYRGAQGHI